MIFEHAISFQFRWWVNSPKRWVVQSWTVGCSQIKAGIQRSSPYFFLTDQLNCKKITLTWLVMAQACQLPSSLWCHWPTHLRLSALLMHIFIFFRAFINRYCRERTGNYVQETWNLPLQHEHWVWGINSIYMYIEQFSCLLPLPFASWMLLFFCQCEWPFSFLVKFYRK